MFDPSFIRYAASTSREIHKASPASLDQAISGLMSDAMVRIRQDQPGGVTREDLARCGFTADELDRLGGRAADHAAQDWYGHGRFDAAA